MNRPGEARKVIERFDLGGAVIEIRPHRAGHINDTYIARAQTKGGPQRFTLQRINPAVFPRPDRIMHNIRIVSETIRKRNEEDGDDPNGRGLTLVSSGGKPFYTDDEGAVWRCYRYIEGVTHNSVRCDPPGIAIAREAAAAFRRFQSHLAGLDARELYVTIDDFHNTPVRFARLEAAAAADPFGRAREAAGEIEAARARRGLCGKITEELDAGRLPLAVVHNDTKINNVVFADDRTGPPRALCVIDLDTVMPGSALFDFGDLARSCVCSRPEDETDLGSIEIDLGLFRALVEGFCGRGARVATSLTVRERELMVTASKVITLETGIRFLTDYLMGDVYFRVARADHNLARARAQLRLLAEMERKSDRMEDIVRETAQ